jgi:hypothetical protein
MPNNPQSTKKPYSTPALVALDVLAAKAKLESDGESGDPVLRKMLFHADEQLSQSCGLK